jgi:site-specific DNA recombinase
MAQMRAAIYVRISTDESRQPWSIGAQKERLEAFCKANALPLAAVYQDEASGGSTDRPGLMRALSDARERRFEVLVFYRLDRFSRSVADTLSLVMEFERVGVTIRSATEPFETSSPVGRMLLQMLASLAELERAMIRDRIKEGVRRRALAGGWTGSLPPGLKFDDDGRPVPDPKHLPVAQRIYEMYVRERLGSTTIARILNAEGAANPRGRKWTPQLINTVLRSSAYAGMVRWNKELLAAAHEPVIDLELWRSAQAIMDKRAQHPRYRRGNTSPYLLSGTVRCGRCGKAYIGINGHGRGGVYEYYTCQGRQKEGKTSCDNQSVRRDHLERAVIEQLSRYLADTTLLERALSQAREERRKSTRDRGESGALARQIRETEEVRERYFKAFETGLLQPAMLQDRLETLSDKSSALQRRLNALTTDADLPEKIPGSAIAAARDLLGRIHGLAPERGKALLQILVKEIVIDSRDDARCTYRLPLSEEAVRATNSQVETAGIEPASAVA